MPLNTYEDMALALKEAEDGTVTLDLILDALQPHSTTMGVLNELIRNIPSQTVLLIFAAFAGCVMFDDSLRAPDISVEDRLELLKRHARIAHAHLKLKMESDPRMAELLGQVGVTVTSPTPKQRRSAFQVMQGGRIADDE